MLVCEKMSTEMIWKYMQGCTTVLVLSIIIDIIFFLALFVDFCSDSEKLHAVLKILKLQYETFVFLLWQRN